MIKSRIAVALAIVVSLFSSCEDDNDLKELFFKESGTFQTIIKDSQSKPYVNKKVSLYYQNELINDVYTNEDGVADFQHLNKGTYQLRGVGFEEGGKQYSFVRTILVVVGEKVSVNIVPSEYCGNLTIELFERHKIENYNYSNTVKQKGGNLVLFEYSKLKNYTYESVKEIAWTEQKIGDDINTVTFNKVPIGQYGLMYYTDEDHYQIFGSRRWDRNGNLINYGLFTITKESDANHMLVVDGTKFYDYSKPTATGTVTISAFSYYKFGYSAKTEAKELKEGKIALIDRKTYSGGTFEQLKEMIVVEKALDGKTNKVEFTDVNVGQYMIMIYTDKDHYQIAKLGYNSSDSYFNVSKDEKVNNVILVNHANVKTVYKDQSFFIYRNVYDSGYKKVGVKGANVYILKERDFQNLDYSFRRSKDVLKMFAIKSGVTGDDGKLNLSIPSYVEVTAVVFDEKGTYHSSHDFYPISQGEKSFRID